MGGYFLLWFGSGTNLNTLHQASLSLGISGQCCGSWEHWNMVPVTTFYTMLISVSPFLGHPAAGHCPRHPGLQRWDVGAVPLSLTAMGKSTGKTHQEREGWSYQYGLRQASLNSANGILPPGTFWSGRQAHIRGWGKLAPAPHPPFLSLNMAGQPVPGGHRRKLLLYRVLAPLPLSS